MAPLAPAAARAGAVTELSELTAGVTAPGSANYPNSGLTFAGEIGARGHDQLRRDGFD